MRRSFALPVAMALAVVLAAPLLWGARLSAQGPAGKKRKVEKTDAQWMKLLTQEQFMVTRRKATEAPFTGKYANNHARGTYFCVCCEAELFSSQAKFDSGTGWPSFFRPIDPKGIEQAADYELGEARVEVLCIACGAHLGHVFPDGPPPTGLRYCINSASLKFKSAAGAAVKTTRGKARGNAKAKSKSKAKGGEVAPEDEGAPKDKEAGEPAGKNEPGAGKAK